MNDEFFMEKAIELSVKAVENGNEPFGAVLVKDGVIVFTNENQIYTKNDPTFHAEMGLIRRFVETTGITDLHEYTMYSSCEPCFMCSSTKLVFENSFWKPQIRSGVLREKSIEVLKSYFSSHNKG